MSPYKGKKFYMGSISGSQKEKFIHYLAGLSIDEHVKLGVGLSEQRPPAIKGANFAIYSIWYFRNIDGHR